MEQEIAPRGGPITLALSSGRPKAGPGG